MNCPHCGATIRDSGRFCSYCGGSLPEERAARTYAPNSPERFAAAEALPSYQQALNHQPAISTSGASPVLMISISTLVLPLMALPLIWAGSESSLSGSSMLWLVALVAVVVVAIVLIRRGRSSGRPKQPVEAQKELVVVLSTESTNAVMNPLTLRLQRKDGSRFECYGLRPVAQKQIAPGDIGVGFFVKQALMGTPMVDFVRLDA